MTNTGTNTWTKSGDNAIYLAAYVKPTDDWGNATPNQALVPIPNDISPGQSVTLSVNMGGVTRAGPNALWIRMLKNGVAWFDPPLKTDIYVYSGQDTHTLYHVLTTGQSNGLGYDGMPCLSNTQPFNNLMLQTTYDGVIKSPGFIPLTECYFTDFPQGAVESPRSAMGNTITNLVTDPAFQVIVTSHGVGGVAYDGLKKGTVPYQNGLAQVTEAKRAAAAAGNRPYKVAAISITHGESDSGYGPVLYQQHLEDWYRDYNQDIKQITGQTDDIPIFTDQMGIGSAFVELGQLKAAEDNPGKIYMVGPKYFLKRANWTHLNNLSYRILGEYHGKAIKKVLVDKQPWVPLSPKTITRSGNTISVKFNVPAPPIVFDTQLVLAQTNQGFEYVDDGPNTPTITGVTITGPDSINITLSAIPTANNQRLRYAFTASATNPLETGPDKAGSARGNVRDSDNTPSLYGSNLYNWLVQFEKLVSAQPVTSTPTPTANSYPIQLTGNTGCFSGKVGFNIDFNDLNPGDPNLLYSIQSTPNMFPNGQIPGKLSLRPLIITDAGTVVLPSTTYTIFIQATSGQRSNDLVLTTPSSCPSPTLSPTLTVTPTTIVKKGDINRDGRVNILDYTILFENFGKNPLLDSRADLTNDGRVNILDYGVLFENFGT